MTDECGVRLNEGNKMKRRKGFLLYFDVLGYKNILQNNTDLENEKIALMLEKFSDLYAKADVVMGYGREFDNRKLEIRGFSENFLIFYESDRNDYEGLFIFELIATRIQYQFLTAGLLTRGSISYEEVLFFEKFVFGKSLVHAVELEENHRMPSIVVDSKLKNIFDGKDIEYQEEVLLFDVWSNSSLDYEDCVNGIKTYLGYLNKSHADNNVVEKSNVLLTN